MPTLTDIVVDFVSLVDRAAVRDPANKAEPQRFLIYKRDPNNPHQEDRMTPEEQKAALEKAQTDLTKTAEERDATKAELTKAQEQIETLTKSVEDIKKAAGITDEPVPVDKSDWPESARIAFEKAEEDRKALDARVAKAESDAEEDRKVAKAERDKAATREFVTKAETFKSLAIKPADFGPILKSAHEKLTKEEYAELERVVTAADNALTEAGIFDEQGRTREGDTPESALAEATQKAEEIRKSDSKLTATQALEKALDADPALQARYLAEARGR